MKRIALYTLLTLLAFPAAAVPAIHNVDGRTTVSLDGTWNAIVDPYENGYYNYRMQPMPTPSTFFADRHFYANPTQLIEYDFDAAGTLYTSGGCFMLTRRGMENILRAFEEWRPGPMDGYLTMNGNRVAVAKRNLAVQIVMGDAMVFDYMRANTHHAAYAPQGIRYEDYAVPDGYGYGAATAGG